MKDSTETIVYIVLGIIIAVSINFGMGFLLKTQIPIVAVESNSMVPTFQKGDILIIQGVPSDSLKKGDIIVFSVAGQSVPVVHRIAEIKADGTYQTKGDANSGQLPFEKSIEYKQIYGNNASIIILQGNENTLVKAQTERLPNHPEWNIFSFYFQPVETTSYMKILLSSPFVSDPLGTKIYYDDLEAYKVFSNDLLLVKDGTPESLPKPTVNFTKASPVEYSGTVSKANRGHIITFSENYSQGWNFSINKKGTDPKISHFSSNLYANSWFIEGAPETYEFNIYYTPQKYFNVGAVISTGTLLAIIYFLRFSFLSVLRRKNG